MCKAGVLPTDWSLWEADHTGMQWALRFSMEMLDRCVKHLYACWEVIVYGLWVPQKDVIFQQMV